MKKCVILVIIWMTHRRYQGFMTEEKIKKLQIPSTIILVLLGFCMALSNNILFFPFFLILLSLSLFLISLRLYLKKYNPILRSFILIICLIIIIICFILVIIAFQNILE